MNKGHKEYQIFQKICRYLGLDEKALSEEINAKGTEDIEITTHNKNTDMSYILNVVGAGSGYEYFMELRENRGDDEQKIILKGHVMIRPPPVRRKAGLTPIFAVMLLIGLAAAGAGAFYVAIDDQLVQRDFIEVHGFKLTPLNPDHTQFLLEMTVASSVDALSMQSDVFVGTYNILPENEFVNRQESDSTDVEGCIKPGVPSNAPNTCVIEAQAGYLINYSDVITLKPCTDCPRSVISVEFSQPGNGASIIQSFGVPR